jgi:nucleoside-diphosphate-sugar epimerase
MKRVVVTGASGFIGQAVVRRLLRDGIGGNPANVIAIVRDPETLPAALRAQVEAHAMDLAEASIESIAAACGDAAVVIHLAASASVAGGERGYLNNVRSTERLIGALRLRGCERLVYASSIGAVDRMPGDDCALPLDENSPPNPLTRYGAGKLEGERMVRESGLPFGIVRPTWVYGPGMRADSHLRVFVAMVRRGSLASHFKFPGRVSVIHVDDLARGLLIVACDPNATGGTFFASDGQPVAIGGLFSAIGEVVGRNAGTIGVPAVVASTARVARRFLPFAAQNLHSDVLLASNSRLASLGFVPAVSLRNGLVELARVTSPNGGRWLVTGAASGIGRALAVQLHAGGADVIASDRDEAGLAALASECAGMRTLAADLSQPDGRATLATVINEGGSIDGVVNCAGLGVRGTVAETSLEAQRALVEVNVVALAELSTLALRRFGAQATGGTLVNVASSAAFQPLPLMAAYAASKAFVLSFTEAAAVEQEVNNHVRVIAICPGGTDTGFQAAAGVRRVEDERLMAPHEVAAVILSAIDRGRSRTVLIGGRTKAMALLARLLPRHVLARLWGRLMSSLR